MSVPGPTTGSSAVNLGREYPWRLELAIQLQGHGVEFGPGTHPLTLGPFVDSVRYCDVHTGDSYGDLFPEFAKTEVAHFPLHIDLPINFDREPFVDRIGAGTLDFIVANHVLEHLVNPFRFLEQCYQLLKPDGLIYLGLPDKRRIFDRYRSRTPLHDVVRRYQHNETDVSDEQIIDALHKDGSLPVIPDRESLEYAQLIAKHRKRTIHANVWILDDLVELLLHFGRVMKMPLALLDGAIAPTEYIVLLRKSDCPEVLNLYPTVLQRIFAESAGLLPVADTNAIDSLHGLGCASQSAVRASSRYRPVDPEATGLSTRVVSGVRQRLRSFPLAYRLARNALRLARLGKRQVRA